MLVGGFIKWAGSEDKTTSNMDPKVSGFLIILLTAGCSFYRYKRIKTGRRRVRGRRYRRLRTRWLAADSWRRRR